MKYLGQITKTNKYFTCQMQSCPDHPLLLPGIELPDMKQVSGANFSLFIIAVKKGFDRVIDSIIQIWSKQFLLYIPKRPS
jgi:hypothetical protein